MKIKNENLELIKVISTFLEDYSTSIKEHDILKVFPYTDSIEESYRLLLASILGLEVDSKDRLFYNDYFKDMIKHLDKKDYIDNPYLKNIKIKPKKNKNWELKEDSYKPYEAFVYNDFKIREDRLIPQIGFFSEIYKFPSVYQNNRLWMSIIPNEINTMEKDINKVYGNVIVCGLGLGYFPYMISLKDNVKSITIIERDNKVIDLFKSEILPQFEYKDKITIIESDATKYLDNLDNIKFDSIYIDLWHDVSDGLPLYLKLLPLRDKYKDKLILFWIEESMKCYL